MGDRNYAIQTKGNTVFKQPEIWLGTSRCTRDACALQLAGDFIPNALIEFAVGKPSDSACQVAKDANREF